MPTGYQYGGLVMPQGYQQGGMVSPSAQAMPGKNYGLKPDPEPGGTMMQVIQSIKDGHPQGFLPDFKPVAQGPTQGAQAGPGGPPAAPRRTMVYTHEDINALPDGTPIIDVHGNTGVVKHKAAA
jgi:hypothetical protein